MVDENRSKESLTKSKHSEKYKSSVKEIDTSSKFFPSNNQPEQLPMNSVFAIDDRGEHSGTTSYTNSTGKWPTGLQNFRKDDLGKSVCVNVCFFNVLVQQLISIPEYVLHILQMQISDEVLRNLDISFNKISKSNVSVDTFQYIQKLNISQYQTGSHNGV